MEQTYIEQGKNPMRPWRIGGAVILMLGIIIAVTIFADAYRSRSEGFITVTGSTQRDIVSDIGQWSGTFSRTVATDGLKDGNALMKSDAQTVMDYLANNGVASSEIELQPVSVYPNYSNVEDKNGNSQQTFTGYTLSQTVIVKSNDVAKITKIAAGSGIFFDKGILFQSSSPQYLYSGLADLKLQMINDATKDAYARADKVAQNAQAKLGALNSASIGVIQITPQNSTDLSGEGEYDTTSIKKTVSVVVHASFHVK